MLKRLLQKTSSEVALKSGNLKPSHLEPRLTAHHGIPASASVLAYEPGQRLLAIASRDGRIKIFGRDGVEVLLKSPTSAPCKYLEFVNNEGRLIHVTTRNDVEVWDLSSRELVTSKQWEVEITAFAVLQGTSFLYLGDETGQVSVLQFDSDHGVLNQMDYNISAHSTLSGLVEPGDTNAPSVVSILPQPDAVHSRVCLIYSNGILVLWGLHEAYVLAVRGGTEYQQRRLSGEKYSASDDEEEKEPCCACWACPLGTVVAVGYTDGDIWLWSMAVSPKTKADFSSSPVLKLSLSSEDFRMPVVVMRWSPSGKSDKGPGGYIYVFGGQAMGMAEAVTVLSVLDTSSQTMLRLRGPFADVSVLPSAAGGVYGTVLVLTSPGSLDVYEEVSIYESLNAGGEPTLQPVPFQLPLTLSSVTSAKLLIVSEESIVAGNVLKIPRVLKGYMPPALASGTRWSVTGGNLTSATVNRKSQPSLYITGHENGLLNVWDASTPCLYFLATVDNRALVGSELASVTCFDICGTTGVMAAGDESGLVFVYTMSPESREGSCLYINKNEPSTKRELQHAAGFQCFAVLNLHQAAIATVLVATDSSCVAIGDEVGLVTLFDIESSVVRFHGKCGGIASIVGFSIMNLPTIDSSPSTPRQEKDTSTILYVLSKDASITAIDGNNGSVVGSGRPKNPSVAVSLHLLDSSGALVRSAARGPTKKVTKQSVLMAVIETDSSGSHIEPASGAEEREENLKQDDDWTATDNFLLLCSEDSLRLYSVSAVLQGMLTTVRKVRLEKPCCSASAFEAGEYGSAILLLYDTGDIEIRSLPELDVLKVTPLTACLNWEFGSSPSFFKTFAVASNGRVAAIDADREVLFMSIVADENDMRLPDSYPLLYDKDIATATEAALKASVQATKKKQSQLQDLLGGVMKEIKHSLGTGPSGDRSAIELPKLFSRPAIPAVSHGVASFVQRLRPGANNQEARDAKEGRETKGVGVGETKEVREVAINSDHQLGSPSMEKESQLEIDDIDLDDEIDSKSPSPSPSSSSGKKGGVMRRLRTSFKGKKKASNKMEEEEERNALFEGGTESKPTQKMPTMRTAEEIKAAYGHKRAGEASSAAAHARDRLMERQERLQNINRRTEEMQQNAENFQSMAEELAKKMEARKWWEI